MLSGGTTPYDQLVFRDWPLEGGKYSTGVGFERQFTSWVLPDTIVLAGDKKISKELFTKIIDKIGTEYFPEEYL